MIILHSLLWRIGVFMLVVLACYVGCSHACTLWAVAGKKVQGEGALLAKNRDRKPQKSELELIIPEKGLTYLGLFSVVKGKRGGLVAGINEKGLSIVSATASSLSKKAGSQVTKSVNEEVLRMHGSVEAVLKNQNLFIKSSPSFYMVADKDAIAMIEVAPHGKISVRTKTDGVLFHTNHYIDEDFLQLNKNIGESSEKRLYRIQSMLEGHGSSFTIDDFVAFSEDTRDGHDNSIWRTGSSPQKERTIATWIVYIPKKGAPEIFLKVANPGEEPWVMNTVLDHSFWTEGTE